MIYYIAIVLLLAGCAADPVYSPSSWPRSIIIENALSTDIEIEQAERVKRSVAMINKHVGAAVYQLAVTNDAGAAGCDSIVVQYVDTIIGSDGKPRTGIRGNYSLHHRPCQAYIQLHLNGSTPPDETVIVHELMHDLLGEKHDEIDPGADVHSVFAIGGSCFADDPSIGYTRQEYCSKWQIDAITPDLVRRIRAVMGLK
jgi:hypothetical protein